MSRRSDLEMEIDVLKALSRTKSLRITHIMYRANLNCTVLKAILANLEGKGLITALWLHKEHLSSHGKSRAFYTITPEGQAVLQSYRLIKAKLGAFD
jgi:predicted transcriptional regulator